MGKRKRKAVEDIIGLSLQNGGAWSHWALAHNAIQNFMDILLEPLAGSPDLSCI